MAASASVHGSLLADNARAGAAVFGGQFDIEGSTLTCNAIDLNVESSFDLGAGPVERRLDLTDGGGNVCGCGAVSAECRAKSHQLEPAPPPEPPEAER